MQEKIHRMKELMPVLQQAAKAYYQDSKELMSNFEYDKLYDELLQLEADTGTVLAGSPTRQVGYEILSELPKETHQFSMLSLDKTKEISTLQEWLGSQQGVLSWKLDGLTIVLTYQNGVLQKAVTRGNGEIGEVITNNARMFENLPLTIAYKGNLILRGEAVIKYSDFIKINQEIEDVDAKYKNPRNLCSGSVRQLNNEVTAKRHVNFMAFALVDTNQAELPNSKKAQLDWLEQQGFEVVDYQMVDADNLEQAVQDFAARIADNNFPSDGLVLTYDDIVYGESLGRTAKFPRHSIAFKWADEISETVLREIKWSPSRTGLINPIAVFDPVELEGTTVTRASVHNISVLEALELGIGDEITVYKANMIIPQIAENLSKSGNVEIPESCPVCGGIAKIRNINDVKSLYCTNPDCQVKKVKQFTHLVSRNALNIEGLSEATVEKLILAGFIKEYSDIFHLDRFKDEITQMEGLGEKSYENLIRSVDDARHTTLAQMIYGLGIAGIGLANAKMISKEFRYDFDAMRNSLEEQLVEIDGIGPILAAAWVAYFQDDTNNETVDHLLAELEIKIENTDASEAIFAGKTFVITGSLEQFENRKALQQVIEDNGGKATGSVTSKTSYLINNDTLSQSSKNKKAKELGVPIISEQQFVDLMKGGGADAD